jgi:large subunit ribosomal protein L9
VAEKMQGLTLQLTQKAGVDGRLFGSVTNQDIAEALKGQGFEVHKAQIRLANGTVKTVGESAIEVVLHTDVACEVTLQVVAEAS